MIHKNNVIIMTEAERLELIGVMDCYICTKDHTDSKSNEFRVEGNKIICNKHEGQVIEYE